MCFMGLGMLTLRPGLSTIHVYGRTTLIVVLLERQHLMISYGTGAEWQAKSKFKVRRRIGL